MTTRITINGHELLSKVELSFHQDNPILNENIIEFGALCNGKCTMTLKQVPSKRRTRFIPRSIWFSIPRSKHRGLEAFIRHAFKKYREANHV